MELQAIHKTIIKLCADDDIGLWHLLKQICGDEYYWSTIPDWLRQDAMNIIRDLLDSSLIQAGNFEREETGVHKWVPILLPADEIIKFIEQEWNFLGKTPNMGDVCWFRATESGEKFVKELK